MFDFTRFAGVVILCCCSLFLSAQTATFYVSKNGNDNASGASIQAAFATIQKAKTMVRAYKKGHPSDTVKVAIAAGRYEIGEPLRFEPADGGSKNAPVIYSALPGGKVIISGGRNLTGWKKFKNNIFFADLNTSATGDTDFSELFVNGERRQCARLPKKGFYRVKGFPDGSTPYNKPGKRFEYNAGDINPRWKNLQDIALVVYHFWTDTHLTIDAVDPREHIVSFRRPSGKAFTDDFNTEGARYIVENVWEGLQNPGEWYIDKKAARVYYIPFNNEDLATAEVVVPFVSTILTIAGDPLSGKVVSNLQFSNLAFEYANIQLPPNSVNNAQGALDVPAAFTLNGAQYCRFSHCTITNISGYAFDIGEGCSNNIFEFNTITHLAGGGFKLNGGTLKDHPLLHTHGNIISDNEIADYGIKYNSAVGILSRHAYGNRFEHNNIHDGYYTGISAGWEWGYQPGISRDNVIAFNHIYNIGKGLLSDMGAIYTLGVSPGTVIRNNLIHDVDAHSYGGWGIYNDEGSSGILVENNIVYNTKFAAYNIHYAKEITVRNNIFAFGKLQQLNRTRIEPHQSVYFENNIIYWKEGILLDGNWDTLSYNYYTNPNLPNHGATRMTHTFTMDYNIFYNPLLPADSVRFYKQSWQDWQKNGNDMHSLYTDPMFTDAAHFDFSLKEHSPAFRLGFNPINMEDVGPGKQHNKSINNLKQ